jgi:hypothetical protein
VDCSGSSHLALVRRDDLRIGTWRQQQVARIVNSQSRFVTAQIENITGNDAACVTEQSIPTFVSQELLSACDPFQIFRVRKGGLAPRHGLVYPGSRVYSKSTMSFEGLNFHGGYRSIVAGRRWKHFAARMAGDSALRRGVSDYDPEEFFLFGWTYPVLAGLASLAL